MDILLYAKLFLSFLQIGAFSFGGGYAAMPLIQQQVVTQNSWLSPAEFADLVTISQMTPGPIAVNAATFVGTRLGGIPGALTATAGCVLPSCLLVTLLAKLYLRYRSLSLLQGILHFLRPAVIALIGAAGVSILITAFWGGQGFVPGLSAFRLRSFLFFLGALTLLIKFRLNPILVMLLCGAAETLFQTFAAIIK